MNDFKGEPTDITDPLEVILLIQRHWAESNLDWWKLREETLLERVNTPRTTSRGEWAQAFSDLSKLIIEGFQTKAIRTRLKEMGIGFNNDDRSLALIEKARADPASLDVGMRQSGLRKVQSILSYITSRARGSQATELEREALENHGTYPAHFEKVCRTVVDELKIIEEAFL